MINKVFILGSLVKKVFKNASNGVPLCVLEVITDKNFTDAMGNKKSITARHIINCFGFSANIANKHAEIGDTIFVEGEIVNKKSEENGMSNIISTITAHDLKVLTLKNRKGNLLNGKKY